MINKYKTQDYEFIMYGEDLPEAPEHIELIEENIKLEDNQTTPIFEFDKPQGFGIQKVYTMEGDIDETYTVKSGDFVEIPRGYHPYHCAPGYKGYMLWIMAGPVRGFYMTTDEEHAWLNK